MKSNFELEIVINDIANTVPGIAYPIPAGNVMNFIRKLLLWRLAKVNIKESINVNNASTIPRETVLIVRDSNSVVKPFFNWSIFNRNHENGIPIENNGGNKVTNTAKDCLLYTSDAADE